MRVTPSLPPKGEAACGEHPLDPSFFGVLFSTFSGVIAIWGMPKRRGRKHGVLEPPRAIDCFYEGFNRAKFSIKQILVDIVMLVHHAFMLIMPRFFL